MRGKRVQDEYKKQKIKDCSEISLSLNREFKKAVPVPPHCRVTPLLAGKSEDQCFYHGVT